MNPPRPIAVLGGTGPEGFGLALRWAQAGETVIIGSRDAKRAQDAAAKIKQRVGANAKISGNENIAACAAADLLVLTVPFEGHAALLKQLKPAIRPGSIVIDATVPLAASVGGRATRTLGVWQGSAAQETAELVPKGVSVVAAFQNVCAELLNADGPVDCDVIVCSDDPNASQVVRDAGRKDSRRSRHRRRQTGERAHPGADHRAADRPEHPAQRPFRHSHHRLACRRHTTSRSAGILPPCRSGYPRALQEHSMNDSPNTRPAIEFRHVSYRVNGDGDAGRELLRDLNLEVQRGETLVLLGRSGSGKTTTLKLINHLLTASSGELCVEAVPFAIGM